MNPFLESDIEYRRSWLEHPANWNGVPRFTSRCSVCGRGMRLHPVADKPDGLKVCGVCRRWHVKLNRTETLRKAPKA